MQAVADVVFHYCLPVLGGGSFLFLGWGGCIVLRRMPCFWVILVHPARTAWCTGIPIGGMGFVQDGHGVSGGFPVYSAGAFVRGVELENLWKGADFLEVSAYIMRVGKTGEVYQGYLGEADVSLLEPGYIYLLGGGLAVVCVEDAVVQGETLNRAVYDGDGNFRAVLAGNLAAVRYGGGCFKDVHKEDIASLEKILKPVERIAYGRVCLKASSTLPVWEGK